MNDNIFARIDRALDECDARQLPPLTPVPPTAANDVDAAAQVIDLAEQVGVTIAPWQQRWLRWLWRTP